MQNFWLFSVANSSNKQLILGALSWCPLVLRACVKSWGDIVCRHLQTYRSLSNSNNTSKFGCFSSYFFWNIRTYPYFSLSCFLFHPCKEVTWCTYSIWLQDTSVWVLFFLGCYHVPKFEEIVNYAFLAFADSVKHSHVTFVLWVYIQSSSHSLLKTSLSLVQNFTMVNIIYRELESMNKKLGGQ